MDLSKYIELNPEIMMGKPVIKRTRIIVELILERVSEGETIQGILIAYPHITQEELLKQLYSTQH